MWLYGIVRIEDYKNSIFLEVDLVLDIQMKGVREREALNGIVSMSLCIEE